VTSLFVSCLLLAAPAFETFDAPLDPARWYVGTGAQPNKGVLRLGRDEWIAARGLPDGDGVQRIEIRFRHRGGPLRLTFHDRREPLTRPVQPELVVPAGKGDRVLVIAADGARVDGEKLAWDGKAAGAFRIGGKVELDEVRVAPDPAAAPPPSDLERRTIFLLTTPERHGEYRRVTLTLWDVPVAFLLRRGAATAVEPLQAKGGPVLGFLVTIPDGRELARIASGHEMAMRDWSDERGNLDDAAFRDYVATEYARFELLAAAQRVMSASLPARKLDALESLAVIRHANAARAAVALAETRKDKQALKLLATELPKGRVSSDQIRAAAGRAARTLLGAPPAEWKGFAFDPTERYVTLQEAKEHLR